MKHGRVVYSWLMERTAAARKHGSVAISKTGKGMASDEDIDGAEDEESYPQRLDQQMAAFLGLQTQCGEEPRRA